MGSEGRLEKKLRKGGGKTAPAQITDAKKGMLLSSSGASASAQVASAHVTWKLKVQVAPDGESSFDATIKYAYPPDGEPTVGSTIGVLYDPNDHTKVVVDDSADGDATALAAAKLSPQATAALQRAASLPPASREALQKAIAMRAQQEQGERKKNPGASATPAAGMADAPAEPSVTTGGFNVVGDGFHVVSASQPDPADEIAKLAKLRDQGALTDAEFQAQKEKILGT